MYFPAALYLPADAFDVASNQVIGRRIAGRLLTQAFASGLDVNETLTIFSPGDGGVNSVQRLIDGHVSVGGVVRVGDQLDPGVIEEIGAIHFPDPSLARWVSLRQRRHPAAFSLTGVIHTVCSDGALRGLGDLPLAPVYPWDAVVCTSTAGQQVVASALEQRLESMLARFQLSTVPKLAVDLPQLPVIPLAGPTQQPFEPALARDARRACARHQLGIPSDHFVVAFVGRLSFHSKCHPLSLYRALDHLAALSNGRPISLIECGHIFNPSIAAAYERLRSRFPGVTFHLVGGLEPASEMEKWRVLAAADVFTSPADNLQETFGLTLLEAMQAELPLVVSDWNGYRDLVVDGENGFLVPTEDILGSIDGIDTIEADYISGGLNYDAMIGLRSMGVAVDHDAYVASLFALLSSPELCCAMSQASLRRLDTRFSPHAVAIAYRELYSRLAEMRSKARVDGFSTEYHLPSIEPSYRRLFGHYPTRTMSSFLPDSPYRVHDQRSVRAVLSDMMNELQMQRLTGGKLSLILSHLDSASTVNVSELVALGLTSQQAQLTLAALCKFGLIDMPNA